MTAEYRTSQIEGLLQEVERLRADMLKINRICYIPTSQGMRAYTHFQRDFDQIRAITAAHINA